MSLRDQLIAETETHRRQISSLVGRVAELADYTERLMRLPQPDGEVGAGLAELSVNLASFALACDELDSLVGDIESDLRAQGGRDDRFQDHEADLSATRRALQRVEARASRTERKLDAIENSRAWRLVRRYWDLRDRLRRSGPPATETRAERFEVEVPGSADETPADHTLDQQSVRLEESLDGWIERARSARGDEVILMFSGTTSYQFKRANRPIRLTKVFLEAGCPVFFSFYRFQVETLPPSEAESLLFQSPIDITSQLLPRLLEADFDEKRKVLFVSFPHELMVRYLLYASQHGWTVVYDVRDDWEEFARVGAAKWYEPEYEWYTARHADVVTAVSWPLARKIETLSGRSVLVNPNALDGSFPRRVRRVDPERPVVGYFGHLTEKWFDWDLVLGCARRYPDLEFELAGHQAPPLLWHPRNVTLLGLLSHDEIAEASSRWAAGIIPFRIGPLSDSVDPIKVYEYLHLGLPTLATYLPQLLSYPGVVVAESAEAFIEAIPRIVEQGLTGSQDEEEWLVANTWEQRVGAYRSAISAAEPARPLLTALFRGGPR